MGVLFPRIEKEKPTAEQPTKAAAKPSEAPPSGDGLIDISEFAKVDIRVARVLEAVPVEGSDKLLELRVDSGSDTRIIIADWRCIIARVPGRGKRYCSSPT